MPSGIVAVTGFHGTSREAAKAILSEGFEQSENEHDWLGDGIYFWVDSPTRAHLWSEEKHPGNSAVIAAEIEIRDCLDLLDPDWFSFVAEAYDSFLGYMKRVGLPIPVDTPGSKAHRLDRAVLNHAVRILEADGQHVCSVRAAFTEGRPAYPGSFLYDLSHIQIAVREPAVLSNIRPSVRGGSE